MSETHEHAHDHEHPPHAHDGKPIQEDALPPLEAHVLETAVRELLIEKGVISSDDIRRSIEERESRNPALGAKIVARAWADPEFKSKLMNESDEALLTFGINMSPMELCVVENTQEVHNMVVCTLCSCYPRPVLGIPPAWYKRRDYRSRAVREPRAVLQEFGTQIPEAKQVRVHDSNADLRYLVLPQRPDGTEGWDEEQLAKLVTRDSMIGVSDALTPAEIED
ncbi:MAG: nitrile hydratase subunit alpha [Alphaproteobacteria bacterium]|nr:nitrile hydratase subunit alpha [Alphaproteobacteria bacterium]